MQSNNWKKDKDLLSEAYAQVNEERSRKDFVSQGANLTDPEADYYFGQGVDFEDVFEDLVKKARQEYGDKFAEQLANVWQTHWPKQYGAQGREAPGGFDELAWKKSPRITKGGKVNKQDATARKSELKQKFGTGSSE